MDALRDWLLGLTAAAFAASAARALTPEGAVKRVVSLAGGLAVVLALAKPLPGLVPALEGLEGDLPAVLTAEEAASAGENVLESLIAQRAGAYIADKGAALGCTCTAAVTVVRDEAGWPVPWAAEIRGRWTEEGRAAMAAAAAELGIPAGRQSFQEEGI